jgi:hypothetical protein
VRCGKIRMKNAVEIEEDCFCRTHIVSLIVKIKRSDHVHNSQRPLNRVERSP